VLGLIGGVPTAVVRDGKQVPNVIRDVLNFKEEYLHPSGWGAWLETSYWNSYFLNNANTVGAPAYWLLNANVSKGHVPTGQFHINVPGEAIADAFRGTPIPDRMIDVKFSLQDVETRYFAKLPAISGARGSGRLQGNRFDLMLEQGQVTLPSGGKLAFLKGTLETPTLHARVIPVKIKVEAKGGARHFVELLDHEPLNYTSSANIEPERMGGNADAHIDVDLKFQKGQKPVIAMKALAEVSDVRLMGIFEQADIDGGDMSFSYGAGRVSAKGTVRLNKVPTFIEWSRNVGKSVSADETLYIEAELDDPSAASGTVTRQYFLPLALASGDAAKAVQERFPAAVVARVSGARKGALYDAWHDTRFVDHLLEAVGSDATTAMRSTALSVARCSTRSARRRIASSAWCATCWT